ncbi:MAG: HD domain-containing protein [Bacteroidales bacterium]|jgi:uncharacterized protein|nr:HD domain-containing protein [Bacteroidales bacterium]
MIDSGIRRAAEQMVQKRVLGYDSGHDWLHTDRVRRMALRIASAENCPDLDAIELAALFHDYYDSKFASDGSGTGYGTVRDFLDENGITGYSERIINAIRNISFSSAEYVGDLKDPVFLIVQDADRLDAIGAIGVARAFNYGGYRNKPIWIPGPDSPGSSTISHFYEKLLLLKDLMNTRTGKELAAERHAFLEIFLMQFHKELEVDL